MRQLLKIPLVCCCDKLFARKFSTTNARYFSAYAISMPNENFLNIRQSPVIFTKRLKNKMACHWLYNLILATTATVKTLSL